MSDHGPTPVAVSVEVARRLLRETHRLTGLAERGGPWAATLQDLAGTLDDLHDALRPPPSSP